MSAAATVPVIPDEPGALSVAATTRPATAVPLVSGRGVTRDYPLPHRGFGLRAPVRHALVDVDIDVAEHETLAIIGESGSGKSTLIRILLGLDTATSGTVTVDGRPVTPGSARATRWLRRQTGIVLQDPYASLDPRRTVGQSVAQPLRALRIPGDHRAAVAAILERVGLHAWRAEQYPHQLSGGQRQRVALARAIVHGPRLLVGDEPLSALDVTIRAQILELLRDLHAERGMGLVLVSHDIGLVQHIADRVIVMKDGYVVEQGPAAQVLAHPTAVYTQALLDAVPRIPDLDPAPPARPAGRPEPARPTSRTERK